MRNIRIAAVLAGALLWLSACAAPEIPFDRASAKVETIGIVTPYFPDSPTVALAATVGQSFGLIGALIDAGIQAARESRFKDAIAGQDYSVRERFLDELTASLKSHGYAVSTVTLQRDSSEFLSVYPTESEPKVDAYLDLVTVSYGYVAAGIGLSLPYRPMYHLRARLVSAKDASVLMQDAISYNPIGPTTKIVTIAPDPEHQFKDTDALVADPTKAIKGLDIAVSASAQTVAKLLH